MKINFIKHQGRYDIPKQVAPLLVPTGSGCYPARRYKNKGAAIQEIRSFYGRRINMCIFKAKIKDWSGLPILLISPS